MDNYLDNDELDQNVIKKISLERVKRYYNKSVLEQVALFLGLCQILELKLKGLLEHQFNCDPQKLEKSTLGQTKQQLKNKGVREDFIYLLETLIPYRNRIAHTFLSDYAMLKHLNVQFSERIEMDDIIKGGFILEQVIIVFDWLQHKNSWV